MFNAGKNDLDFACRWNNELVSHLPIHLGWYAKETERQTDLCVFEVNQVLCLYLLIMLCTDIATLSGLTENAGHNIEGHENDWYEIGGKEIVWK